MLATVALTWVGYSSAKRQYLDGLDRQLTAASVAVPDILGDGYLRRAMQEPGIPDAEYNATVHRLSKIADDSGVYYVYAFVLRRPDSDGPANELTVLHIATSASDAERKAGDWSKFHEPYEQPPEPLLQTFTDGTTRFAEYTDEFGSFRSIFVRHTVAGQMYVVGVDISLADIQRELRRLVMQYIIAGLGVAALGAGLGVLIARRVSQPIVAVNREVESWSSRDFAADESIRDRLNTLANSHHDEAGDLAGRFVQVQDRLRDYIERLTESTTAQQRMEHQLEIAKSIQEGLLPSTMPHIDHFEIFGWSKPADQTGGDYFDWQMLPNGQVVLTIGDVTGHGIGPALVTAASRAYARATFQPNEALENAVARLNDLLHHDLQGERFVTLIACLLDPVARHMKLVAAGHGPVLFYSKAKDCIELNVDAHGVPLGLMNSPEFDRPLEIQFAPGDALILVSDGFSDWMDSTGDTFGTDRLQESVLASCREDQTKIIERLRADIARFNQGILQHDDTTALVIRCVS